MWIKWLMSLLRMSEDFPELSSSKPKKENEMSTNTGKKYAVIIGINKYTAISGSDLNGCVNDAEDMWNLLTKSFGYDPDNIRMLTDERATQQNILERLEWLVSSLKQGDTALLHYSGHGSQIRARSNDTSELDDHMTEILCPTDISWDDPLTDDILAGYFKRVPDGAFLTFIADCCHSGSLDRGFGIQEHSNPHKWVAKFIVPPIDIRARSSGRDLDIQRLGRRANNDKALKSNICIIDQRHLLLSGCRDDQTSADACANGKWGGALTQTFLEVLGQNKDKSWKEIHDLVLKSLAQKGYSQVPQLTGPSSVIDKAISL